MDPEAGDGRAEAHHHQRVKNITPDDIADSNIVIPFECLSLIHILSGILPENQRTVAILLPKSFQLLAAMSGIAQFGAAWIILSPDLPVQRIKEILEDSGAGLIIGNQELLNRCRKSFGNIPVLDVYKRQVSSTSGQSWISLPPPDGFAYTNASA